ncbi:universal stress protein [Nocardioides sp.]|uniref:universal stress protein n=1 Tax=Nocardioides sp. TaxID=35761 RepID=UPI002ED97230
MVSSHPIVVSVPNGDLDPALRFAATEAALHGTPVRLVHAYEPGPSLSGPPVTQAGATEVLRRALQRAEQVLGPDIEVSGGLVRGPAVESVLDASHEAWVVVLQRRDLLHLIRSLTRSMDRAAVRRAHLPLVCVPPTEVASAGDRPVTVGVDAPEHSTALLRAAVAIAHERDAPLRVLHTWSFPRPYDDAVLQRVGREWEAWAHEDIENVLRGSPVRDAVQVDIEIHHGPPLPALLAAAEDSRLMVLGRHGVHRALGSRLGPVTRAVLHDAPCPVLLLPTAELPADNLVGAAHRSGDQLDRRA